MLRRVERLRQHMSMPDDPRRWMLYLIDGEPIPEFIKEQIGERDQVVVRFFPVGYCEVEGDVSLGHVMSSITGQITVLHRSGAQKEVPRERTYRSRATRRRF